MTNWKILNRKIHFWGSAIIAIPILVVIITGIILLLKKDINWIQPSTEKTTNKIPSIEFSKIIDVAKSVEIAEVKNWKDINRLDVRPNKGIIKIRTNSNWEIQIDQKTGQILKTDYRRSDIIESIHDGSFFHNMAKYLLFLPSSIILLVLWITGIYLFIITINAKNKKRKK